jgi:hypothetical protein
MRVTEVRRRVTDARGEAEKQEGVGREDGS